LQVDEAAEAVNQRAALAMRRADAVKEQVGPPPAQPVYDAEIAEPERGLLFALLAASGVEYREVRSGGRPWARWGEGNRHCVYNYQV
jgi:hypothetical protein